MAVTKQLINEVLNYNVSVTDVHLNHRRLYNKCKTSPKIFNNIISFFDLCREAGYTDDDICHIFYTANDHILFVFCSCLATREIKDSELYQKIFPTAVRSLIRNKDFMYQFLFKSCQWHFVYPVFNYDYYSKNTTYLNADEHLQLIRPLLKEIYDSCGEYFYNRCRRGCNLMIEFFVLFQEFMSEDMIQHFLKAVQRKVKHRSYGFKSVLDYLVSPYIRCNLHKDDLAAINVLFKLL